MSLLEHINYLVQASANADVEDQALAQKHGISTGSWINPLDSKVIEWTFEDRKEVRKIEAYLKELDYDTLLKLEALMYFGRDRGRTLKRFQETLRYLATLGEQKDEIIETIIEKRGAYPVYFQGGLEVFRRKGVDPDSI